MVPVTALSSSEMFFWAKARNEKIATSPLLYGTQGLVAVSRASRAPSEEFVHSFCNCSSAACAPGSLSPLTHLPST